ncbi:unnamed protein product (macronuclear) [Paramecium tetraurelia]|uniref:Chromosome undetermined scaffold_149, whole genome shotgun sequence n=1 Tax=Paramecium tetraurelia TaxID=5888 RepID=Q3SDH1_PARTE|nr:uncharacterized protein GSPATT00035145001 [Paramecium tetraurelia]CAI39387.1 EPI40 [Paramecium tetraurelia]CAK65665.1 unnamed protein product [Paramecium tetraurelia]|eukprot:XP_001433062.1 hypothetical protein (macronuclear) [Paramecium tetraurelia strain d4-2]
MANLPPQQYSPPSNLPTNNREPQTFQQPTIGQPQVARSNLPIQSLPDTALQYLPQQIAQQPYSSQPLQQPLYNQLQPTKLGPQQPIFGQSQIQQIAQPPQEGNVVKGQSRIEYIPYERTITEYEEVRRQVQVPITKQVTDYYAVQYDIEYIPQVIQEKQIEYVPVERVAERTEYYTVEKQNVIQQPIGYQSQIQTNYIPEQFQYNQIIERQSALAYQPYQQQTQIQTREVTQYPVAQQQQYIQQLPVQQSVPLPAPQAQYLPTQYQQYASPIGIQQPQYQIQQTVPLNYGQQFQASQIQPAPKQPIATATVPQGYQIPTQTVPQQYINQQVEQDPTIHSKRPQQQLAQTAQYNPQLQQTVGPNQFAQSVPQQQSLQQDLGRTRPYQQQQQPQPQQQQLPQQQQGVPQKPNKEKSFLEKLFD